MTSLELSSLGSVTFWVTVVETNAIFFSCLAKVCVLQLGLTGNFYQRRSTKRDGR